MAAGRPARPHRRPVLRRHADWAPIAELVELLDIPVLGNGDIWEADDALRMVARDRLRRRRRRPRLPGPAVAVRRPRRRLRRAARAARLPDLREVAADHAPARRAAGRRAGRASAAAPTSASTSPGTSRDSRSAATLRAALATASALAELDDLLGRARPDQPFPARVLGRPARAHERRPRRSRCPRAGWTAATPAPSRRGRARGQRRLTRTTPVPDHASRATRTFADRTGDIRANPVVSARKGRPNLPGNGPVRSPAPTGGAPAP